MEDSTGSRIQQTNETTKQETCAHEVLLNPDPTAIKLFSVLQQSPQSFCCSAQQLPAKRRHAAASLVWARSVGHVFLAGELPDGQ